MTTSNEISEGYGPNQVIVKLIGPQGQRGRGWYSGSGAPTAGIGRVGDFYIDTVLQRYYGPKDVNGWPAPFYTAGAIVTRYTHVQSTPADHWVVQHGLGGRPSIVVVDTAGTVVIGSITYVSNLEIHVDFTSAFSGYAYLT